LKNDRLSDRFVVAWLESFSGSLDTDIPLVLILILYPGHR
jgi:hypothetical protein